MRNPLIALTLIAAFLPLSSAMARQSNGYVVRTTTMRAGPAYDYPAVQRLYRNSRVAVYGCLRDWSWCDVGNRYARGWVARRDLTVSYLGRRRNVGSSIGLVVVTFSFGSYWENHYRTRPFYSQRTQWQQQYTNNYRPEWGPRPRGENCYSSTASTACNSSHSTGRFRIKVDAASALAQGHACSKSL